MKRLATKTLIAVFVMLAQTAGYAAVCFGESGASESGSGLPNSGGSMYAAEDTFGMIAKVIFFLILIIVIFLVIVKIVAQKNKFFGGRSLRSLGGLPLGQNKSIQVIEIGKSLYIIGVGDNIQLLEKIDDEEEVAILSEMMSIQPSIAAPNFETIGGWLKKLRSKPNTEEELDIQGESFQQVFQSKISDRKKMMEELLKQDKNSDRLNDKS